MSEVIDLTDRRRTRAPTPEKPTEKKRRPTPDWDALKQCYEAGYTLGQLASLKFADGISRQAIHKRQKLDGWVKDESREARLRAKKIMAAADAEAIRVASDPEAVLGDNFSPQVDVKTAEIMSSEDVVEALANSIAKIGQRQKGRANSLHFMWDRIRGLVGDYLNPDTNEEDRGKIGVLLWGNKTLPIEALVRLTHAHTALQDKERTAWSMNESQEDKPGLIIPTMPKRGTFSEAAKKQASGSDGE